jgi:hypothetical protein
MPGLAGSDDHCAFVLRDVARNIATVMVITDDFMVLNIIVSGKLVNNKNNDREK